LVKDEKDKNMNKELVSIIIVNYNGLNFLKGCLSSLMVQTYPDIEIIFVDNGSMDESAAYVKKEFPSVRIVVNKENFGFAKGNNIGINDAKGDLIATLNNDTKVSPVWIEELVKAINSRKDVGMCASKMLFMKDSNIINSTGIYISRSGACWDRGIFEKDTGQYDSAEDIFGPCAGAAMYKKDMLQEVGLFDEDFCAYVEDVDLAFRGRLSGWKCIYVPKAIVYHVHGGTAGCMTDYTVYHGDRNIIWNCVKNFPIWLLITSAPWIIGRNVAMLPYYILKGHTEAIIKSKIDAIKGIPKMLAKRPDCKVEEREIKKYIRTWAFV
jgi:hypothetical protein